MRRRNDTVHVELYPNLSFPSVGQESQSSIPGTRIIPIFFFFLFPFFLFHFLACLFSLMSLFFATFTCPSQPCESLPPRFWTCSPGANNPSITFIEASPLLPSFKRRDPAQCCPRAPAGHSPSRVREPSQSVIGRNQNISHQGSDCYAARATSQCALGLEYSMRSSCSSSYHH